VVRRWKAVIVVLVALGSAPCTASADEPATKVDPATRERSRTAFRRGVAHLRASEWAAARASFEDAYALVPHPSILLNLGIARLKTGDPVLAEQDLVRFLSEDSGAAPDELASARDALAEARAKIGTLRVIASPDGAQVAVDGKAVAARAGVAEARLRPGTHAVAVSADRFVTEQRSVDVVAKGEAEVTIALHPVPEPEAPAAAPAPAAPPDLRTRKIVGWSLAGFSGVALVASGVMAARAFSLQSDYETAGTRAYQARDVKSEGIGFRTGADVALSIGLAAGATAAILLVTRVGLSKAVSSRPPLLVTW
jgi:hypothetical protein